MESTNSSIYPDIVRTFRAILHPRDILKAKGNTFHLHLNSDRNQGPYLAGVHKLFEFYGLCGIHNIELFYKASKEFSIKISNE
ncbi:hypothetical protein SESBI_16727 [Sesbania bispinosa]|nr:hypothetical protein SESBI_16727 [Sesbania bispinosa]